MLNLKRQDKRTFQRLPAEFPLSYLDLNANQQGNGITIDIGGEGIGLITNKALVKNTPLDIWINLPDNAEPLRTKGTVAWSNSGTADAYNRVGIKLKKVDFMDFAPVLAILRERKKRSLT
ncbi:MAG: PilZ domain-containing protein [Candidatus Omnitrophica bacterium]|nr:PilZ domain-containing protein [Candidatus Omnitrophota bacterium]